MWHIDCSNTKTCKSQNLICIGWDGGNHEARVKAFLVLREAGTHDRCINQSSYESICIVTSCKTMLIYPCTKICMYCCYDPTTQLNKLSPIKTWIPEKKFRNCSSETGKARKLTRALVLANRELPSPSTLPQPLCTPKTSAPPPPTCPASPRAWPSCSPK